MHNRRLNCCQTASQQVFAAGGVLLCRVLQFSSLLPACVSSLCVQRSNRASEIGGYRGDVWSGGATERGRERGRQGSRPGSSSGGRPAGRQRRRATAVDAAGAAGASARPRASLRPLRCRPGRALQARTPSQVCTEAVDLLDKEDVELAVLQVGQLQPLPCAKASCTVPIGPGAAAARPDSSLNGRPQSRAWCAVRHAPPTHADALLRAGSMACLRRWPASSSTPSRLAAAWTRPP